MSVFVAKVKNVISADTVILVPSKTAQVPAPERMLTLSYVRGDSFEAKEALRTLIIGKDVKFKVLFKIPSGKEFGDIQTPIFKSLVEYGLEKGWFKLKDNNDDSDYLEDVLKPIEAKARASQVGVWATSSNAHTAVEVNDDIIEKSQKSPITTIIEKVISGDRVIARIILNKSQYISTPLLLAGYKSPRTDDATQSASLTKVAHQAKEFVESKLLTTTAALKTRIVGLSQSGLPIAIIEHPSGNNIHEKLLENGLGEIVDWQSSLIGSSIMGQLRKAEQTAKALGRGIYAGNAPKPVASTSSNGKQVSLKSLRPGASLEGLTVAKVVTADTLVLRLPSDEEFTVQLASLRAPRQNDSTLTTNPQEKIALVNSAREYVRHQAIGKTCSVYIDGLRSANKDLGFEERFLVSVKINGKDLSETIIQNGWATVIKHNKATSHERSLNWDKLVELEQEQEKLGKKGVYFKGGDISKVLTVGTRVVDASENLTKAKTFFNGFKQKGRISGGYFVEFIPSMNRVKLFNPKEGLKLTLILGGLTNSRSEADQNAEEGLKFMNKKFLQRSVEFEVYDQDKVGGYIGNLFANSKSLAPVQVTLLEQGLTSVHEIAVNSNNYANELTKAEDLAKSQHKGIWANYDASKVQAEISDANAKMAQLSVEASKPKFFDIEVTDIDDEGIISFQLLDQANKSKLDLFKRQFAEFHAQIPSASNTSVDLPHNLNKAPKKNDLVSAKSADNGKYYRAKVASYDKATGKYEVKYIDFGNVDFVPLSQLRLLPAKFGLQSYAPFAHTCVLQNIRLPPTKPTDYLTEALYSLEDLCYDRKLVISALPHSGSIDYTAVLYDSEESLKDPSYTINKELVSKGWGVLDIRKASAVSRDYDQEILAAQKVARSRHLGCWEFGDITFDDDLE
ncbi:hypothetical protein CAAN1_11S03554 [[Candida] anglica]|uniref:Endonuclease LCL3 n=1 Tax=[Candida] anglica TaxID=148631 RepID=A0ABP0EHX9_9ASCO